MSAPFSDNLILCPTPFRQLVEEGERPEHRHHFRIGRERTGKSLFHSSADLDGYAHALLDTGGERPYRERARRVGVTAYALSAPAKATEVAER